MMYLIVFGVGVAFGVYIIKDGSRYGHQICRLCHNYHDRDEHEAVSNWDMGYKRK